MSGTRQFVRPVAGWWRRPMYRTYMMREATCVFVGAYALVLLVGLVRLAQGPGPWNAWVQALRAPLALGFHALVVLALAYHAVTWFLILPKTMAPPALAGRAVPPRAIAGVGLAAALLGFFAVLVAAVTFA